MKLVYYLKIGNEIIKNINNENLNLFSSIILFLEEISDIGLYHIMDLLINMKNLISLNLCCIKFYY